MSARLSSYLRIVAQRKAALARHDDETATALEREMGWRYDLLDEGERAMLSLDGKGLKEKKRRRRT